MLRDAAAAGAAGAGLTVRALWPPAEPSESGDGDAAAVGAGAVDGWDLAAALGGRGFSRDRPAASCGGDEDAGRAPWRPPWTFGPWGPGSSSKPGVIDAQLTMSSRTARARRSPGWWPTRASSSDLETRACSPRRAMMSGSSPPRARSTMVRRGEVARTPARSVRSPSASTISRTVAPDPGGSRARDRTSTQKVSERGSTGVAPHIHAAVIIAAARRGDRPSMTAVARAAVVPARSGRDQAPAMVQSSPSSRMARSSASGSSSACSTGERRVMPPR